MLNNDALKMVNLGTGDYSSAANKLTEAINLAYKFPSVAVNDLVVLYNNRRYNQAEMIILFFKLLFFVVKCMKKTTSMKIH